MDIWTLKELEEKTKPSLLGRICLRLRFGKDSLCDACGIRTWWNGNIFNANGINIVLCDNCNSKTIK